MEYCRKVAVKLGKVSPEFMLCGLIGGKEGPERFQPHVARASKPSGTPRASGISLRQENTYINLELMKIRSRLEGEADREYYTGCCEIDRRKAEARRCYTAEYWESYEQAVRELATVGGNA